jgi:2',3'-cyclic-nucleotide 2'-phosphodiesterase (5'-nucleotidase family)
MSKFLLLLFIALSGCAHEKKDQSLEFILLHTNDSHGHIENFSVLQSVVKQIREGNDHVLLLDAGDTLSDTLESMHDKGETVSNFMVELGYDAMVPGNHDFDYGVNRLLSFSNAGLPLIAANLLLESGKPALPPYMILNRAGLRIGVIGITYPKTPFTTDKQNIEQVKFNSDLKKVIEASIQKLQKERAQIIILLTHLGLSKDIEVAETIPGIDLIVGGHSHNKVLNPLRIKNTYIFQAGAHLQNLGKAKFLFRNGELFLKDYDLMDINPSTNIKKDQEIAKRIQRVKKKVNADKILARSKEAIPRADTIAGNFPRKRKSQSLADSLFADLLHRIFKSDGVILPGVGYGLPLPKGEITLSNLRNLIPHKTKLYRIRLKGKEIKEVIEQSLENIYTEDVEKQIGGLIQVAGIEFTYYPERPKSKRVSSLLINGAPYIPSKDYKIITIGLLAEGGHFYKTIKHAERKELLKEIYPELIEKLFEKERVITSPKDLRMIEIPIIKRNKGK